MKQENILLTTHHFFISNSTQYSLQVLGMNNLELLEHIDQESLENPFIINDSNYLYQHDWHAKEVYEIPNKYNMRDDFLRQICFFNFSDIQRKIAIVLFDHLLVKKYISTKLIHRIMGELFVSYDEILGVISKLNTISSPGMFYFSIHDKIRSLIKQNYNYDDIKCEKIIKEFFSAIDSQHSFKQSKIRNINSEVREIISKIYKIGFCNDCFTESDTEYSEADFIIEEVSPDTFESYINPITNSSITIDEELYSESKAQVQDVDDKRYLETNYKNAKFLLKCVKQRHSTIKKIVNEIFYRQHEFLMYGNSRLIPMNIECIANSLCMNESTISRAINGKIIRTPYGVFDIKHFFPKRVKTTNDNIFASDTSIKEYIRHLINNEPSNSPYTDDVIMNFLQSRGIDISRRTVSKYRSSIGILGSSMRMKEENHNFL